MAGSPGGELLTVTAGLAVILVAAKVGGDVAQRLKQPAALGELVAGIGLGGLGALGLPFVQSLGTSPGLDLIAQLGALILLFEVGLESTVGQMMKVGLSSLLVAVLGVVAPMGLGWAVGAWLLPHATWHAHAFLGATLCATSVGLTARVLQDLGRSQGPEARIILGAAVIDDVLGLVVLAVMGAMVAATNAGTSLALGSVAWIVAKAALFLLGAIALGVWLSPLLFRAAARLRARGVLLATALAFCFALSWAAGMSGLAPIVGAFAAGLVLEDVHFRNFAMRGELGLGALVHPLSTFLVPVFFVLMGLRTDLRAFANPDALALAAALTVAAILGKQACALGVLGGAADRLSVGIGMIPRGEVGLIFAAAGLAMTLGGKPLIDAGEFSALVITVVVTTLITPPALTWSLNRRAP